jgi:hypothetical protein
VSGRVVGQFVGADSESEAGKNGIRVGDGFHNCESLWACVHVCDCVRHAPAWQERKDSRGHSLGHVCVCVSVSAFLCDVQTSLSALCRATAGLPSPRTVS